MLQVRIHRNCLRGCIIFTEAYRAYANDCLTDVKETAYCLKRLMGYVRNLGDGPHFYGWQREVTYSERDRKVVLITNMENHMTDWKLYLAGKGSRY